MAVQISGNDITVPRDGSFTRNVTIGGTLTYEDVTNIDSVGLVTARNGIEIGARPGVAASISVDGNMIVSGISTLGDHLKFDTTGKGIIFGADGGSNRPSIIGNYTSSSNNNIVFNVTGSERARITSTGNFGIGAVSANAKLVVSGDSSSLTGQFLQGADTVAERTIFAQSTNGNNFGAFVDGSNVRHLVSGTNDILTSESNYVALHTNSGTERLRITSGGQVLTGHDTASTNFHDPQTTIDRTPQIQIHGGNSVQSSAALVSWNSNAGSYYSNALFLAHSGSNTIGTNSIVSSSNTLGSIVFSGDDGDEFIKGAMISAHVDGTPGADDMPGRLQFWTNSGSDAPTERMRIGSNGQVTLKPDSNLNEVIRIAPGVDASDTQEYGISWASNANHTHPAAKITILEYDASDSRGHLLFYTRGSNTDSAPTERMRIAHDGTVNIPGGVDGGGLLHVGQNTSSYVRVEDLDTETYGIVIRKSVSSTYAALRLVNTNGHKGNLNVSNSGVALANASDYRLKENETTISDGITRVKQLIPRRFNFKTDSTTIDGFFAHEVSPVVPESVFGEKDAPINEEGDGYQMLDQSKLIPVLTASIKELIAKVETLEAEVAALKSN